MNPKSSVPFALLKLPGMNAIQAALQPRSAGAVQPINCKSSKDRDSLVQHQANMAVLAQQPNPAQPGGRWQRGVVPTSPAANSFLRRSPPNFPKT
jgi:hypothetical protein